MGCRTGDRWRLIAGVLALICLVAGGARSQTLDWNTGLQPYEIGAFPTLAAGLSAENDTKNIGVLQRPHPEYQAQGVRIGGLLLYPSVTVGAAYDDNIFVTQTGAVGDAIFTATPEVDLQSNWPRNLLWAYAKVAQDLYATHSDQDATQVLGGLGGALDLGDTRLSAGAKAARYVLPRAWDDADLVPVAPIPYDYVGVFAEAAHTFDRLKLSARADDQTYRYQNGVTSEGALVFQEGQNRSVTIFTGKAEYALSPDTAAYLTGAFNSKRYEFAPGTGPQALNSQGYRIVAGVSFNLTDLVRGDLQFGYLDQRYVSPLSPPVRGPSASGRMDWFVTPLTTVTVSGQRAVQDAGVIGSSGYVATAGSVEVDHELLRNLILGASFAGGRNAYQGIQRTDDLWNVACSAAWRLSRKIGLTLAYAYADQTSRGSASGPSYKDSRVSLTASFRY